jgi:hypothetical protein
MRAEPFDAGLLQSRHVTSLYPMKSSVRANGRIDACTIQTGGGYGTE